MILIGYQNVKDVLLNSKLMLGITEIFVKNYIINNVLKS